MCCLFTFVTAMFLLAEGADHAVSLLQPLKLPLIGQPSKGLSCHICLHFLTLKNLISWSLDLNFPRLPKILIKQQEFEQPTNLVRYYCLKWVIFILKQSSQKLQWLFYWYRMTCEPINQPNLAWFPATILLPGSCMLQEYWTTCPWSLPPTCLPLFSWFLLLRMPFYPPHLGRWPHLSFFKSSTGSGKSTVWGVSLHFIISCRMLVMPFTSLNLFHHL